MTARKLTEDGEGSLPNALLAAAVALVVVALTVVVATTDGRCRIAMRVFTIRSGKASLAKATAASVRHTRLGTSSVVARKRTTLPLLLLLLLICCCRPIGISSTNAKWGVIKVAPPPAPDAATPVIGVPPKASGTTGMRKKKRRVRPISFLETPTEAIKNSSIASVGLSDKYVRAASAGTCCSSWRSSAGVK